MSDKLNDQYFGKKGYYGDGANSTSKIDSLRIYNRTVQKETLDGLVVVSYESKIGNADFKKATVLFEVSFDVHSGKLQTIQNLGNHVGSDELE